MPSRLALAALLAAVAPADAQVATVTDANWASTIEGGDSPWMVEFYAPWCGHCKAFAPVWEEVGTKLDAATGVKFAKVDATAESASAAKFGVKSYPKIFFLEKTFAQDNDQYREFKGGRNAVAVEKFVHKIMGPPVVPLEDPAAAGSFTEKNDITFVLFTSGGSEGKLETEYAEHGKQFLDTLYLGSCDDASLFPDLSVPETPAVAAINAKAGGTAPAQWYTAASTHTLEEFILATQFPPMVALERSNFWQISNAGKLVLLAVVDPGHEDSLAYRKLVSGVAERYQYDIYSGWLDGVEWEKYVNELFMVEPDQVKEGTVVVYDAPNKQFYQLEEPTTTEAAVQKLIDGVLDKSLIPIGTERGFVKASKRVFFDMVNALEDNPVLMVPLALPMLGLGYLVMAAGDEGPKED